MEAQCIPADRPIKDHKIARRGGLEMSDEHHKVLVRRKADSIEGEAPMFKAE